MCGSVAFYRLRRDYLLLAPLMGNAVDVLSSPTGGRCSRAPRTWGIAPICVDVCIYVHTHRLLSISFEYSINIPVDVDLRL